ncbi:MAG: alkaline shock response membrane anchor protein AmaP [Clostridiales bacterium]|nr:alkaline shock response membrane anchor protein AmaP [Clostridiales bacterium]
MKTNVLNKLLQTIYTIIILLLSLAVLAMCVAVGINVINISQINLALQNIQLNWQLLLITSLISVLFIIISLKLLFARPKPKVLRSTLLRHTDLGAIRVSVETLEIMTQKVVRSFNEVKDVRVNIITEEDGVKIQLKLLMMPDVVLPDVSASIQEKVKEYIQSYSGILVKEVFIYIDNLVTPQQRSKVQ